MIFNSLWKSFRNQLSDQKGIALIVMVLMLWFVAIAAISEMLVVTGTQLAEANLDFALMKAEQVSVATTSPIRAAIDRETHRRLQRALLDHLRKDAAAKSGNQVYVCQGVTPSEVSLSRQMSICDPVKLLDNLPGAKNQTIDFVSALKPDDPKMLKTKEWKELERQMYNRFEYVLKSAFVGQEVLEEPKAGEEEGKGEGVRVERYRWLVRAESETQIYDNILYPFTTNYDVVVTVTAIPVEGGTPQCENPSEPDGEFDEDRPSHLVRCTEPKGAFPYGPECKQIDICPAVDPESCYKECFDKNQEDKCPERARENGSIGFGFVAPGVIYKGRHYSKTYTSTGCASIGGAAKRPSLPSGGIPRLSDSLIGNNKKPRNYVYTWTTAIRIVGLGTNYD